MTLDLFSVSIMTAAVVIVSGVVYIAETLIRRDEGSGRHWAIAFMSGIITTVSYAAWSAGGGWVPVAIGNAFFVAATGFIWLGCRSYNHRRMDWSYAVVGAGMLLAFGAVAIEGPDGGDWAGVLWMYLVLTVLASFGFAETLRGRMAETRTTVALALVLAIEAVYTAMRAIVFIAAGPDSEVFQTWFATIPSSFVTITLVITAVVVTSILRAGRAGMRTYTYLRTHDGSDRILAWPQFRATVDDVLDRAAEKRMSVGIVAVRIDDLPNIATAFGNDIARDIAVATRDAIREGAAPLAVIGDVGPTTMMICGTVTSAADARQQAAEVATAIFDALRGLSDAVIPVVGVGVATTDVFGYDTEALAEAADEASRRSSTSNDVGVLFAEPPATTGGLAVVEG